MSYNGSGSFAVQNTFVPNTTILSALVNGNNTDFASGLSNCMTKDGQQVAAANQPMGNFKLTGLGAGSARTDSISLGQSQDGGVNWIVSGGAADAITATYAPALTALIDGQLCYFRATAANATTTPTFAPNGLTAHTITKVGGTALVAGDIPGNLSECALRYNLANTRWELVNPAVPTASIGAGQFASSASGFNEPINLQLAASVPTNLLTIAIKTTAGTDPTAADPVLIPFRDSTVANGGNNIIKVTSALSINTNAAGASLGTAANSAFRFWVVAFNNGGTVVLALINCLNPTTLQIFPLNDRNVASSTAMSGAATSAGVFYTPNGGTPIANKAFCVLGFLEYNSTGLVTPGTYTAVPQFVQLAGPHTPRPGSTVQLLTTSTTTAVSVSITTFVSFTAMATALSSTSAANLVEAQAFGNVSTTGNGASTFMAQIFRNTGSTGFGSTAFFNANGATNQASSPVACYGLDFPNSTSPQYGLQAKDSSGSVTFNFLGAPIGLAVTTQGQLIVKEVMA